MQHEPMIAGQWREDQDSAKSIHNVVKCCKHLSWCQIGVNLTTLQDLSAFLPVEFLKIIYHPTCYVYLLSSAHTKLG